MVVVSAVVTAGSDEEDQRRLEACLASIEAQTLDPVEVIVVDTGAAGGTAAARDAGARRAAGEYVVFVDAAQRVPPYAFGAMASGLRTSGSDFATAAPPGALARPVPGTHVTGRPALLADRSASGRMWRRDFLESTGASFAGPGPLDPGSLDPGSLDPGPLADMRVVVGSHFRAAAVDVLTAPLVLGPDPAAVPSAAPVGALFAAVAATAAAVDDAGGAHARAAWDGHVLSHDLAAALAHVEHTDADARRAFAESANAYMDTVDPRVFRRIPVIDRLKWYLVRRHLLDDLVGVLAFEREAGPEGLHADAFAVRRGTRWYADYPFLDDPIAGVPQEVYRLGGDIGLRQRAESTAWNGDRIAVSGRLHLEFLPPDTRFRQYLRARALNPGTGAKARARVWARAANAFALPRGAVTRDRDWGGYELRLDPRDLMANGVWRPGEWHVELWAVNRGATRRAPLACPEPGAASRPAPREVEPGVWIRPEWRGADGLVLTVDPLRVRITGCAFSGTGADTVLEITGDAAETVSDAMRLRFTRRPGDAVHEVGMVRDRAGGTFRAALPADVLLDGFDGRRAAAGGPPVSEVWDVHLVDDQRIECRVPLAPDGGGRARVGADRIAGIEPVGPWWAGVRVGLERPLIAGAEWRGGELRISGPFALGTGAVELVLTERGGGDRYTVTASAADGGDFAAVLPTGADTAPPDGCYALSVRLSGADGQERPVDVDPALLGSLPFAGASGGRAFLLDADGPDAPLFTAGPGALGRPARTGKTPR